jgi:hypothetical protein
MKYEIVETHISDIKHGDVIIEGGYLVTVSRNYIKNHPMLGRTVRGNSYNCGRKPVLRAVIKRAIPDGSFVNA